MWSTHLIENQRGKIIFRLERGFGRQIYEIKRKCVVMNILPECSRRFYRFMPQYQGHIPDPHGYGDRIRDEFDNHYTVAGGQMNFGIYLTITVNEYNSLF